MYQYSKSPQGHKGCVILFVNLDTNLATFRLSTNIPNKQTTMATAIFQLEFFSDEIILKVFGYLDIDDLFKCSLTSRRQMSNFPR